MGLSQIWATVRLAKALGTPELLSTPFSIEQTIPGSLVPPQNGMDSQIFLGNQKLRT